MRGSSRASGSPSEIRGRRAVRPGARGLAEQGIDVPTNPHDLYEPMADFPGSDDHGSTWAPAQFPAELSQTAFVRGAVVDWITAHGDEPFFIHASFIRPHPPRRNPLGYHDLYDADAIGGFTGHPTRQAEGATHPFAAMVTTLRGVGAPEDERERRQIRATCSVPARSRRSARPPVRFLDHQRVGRIDVGRGYERPRRDGRRSLVARKARVLG